MSDQPTIAPEETKMARKIAESGMLSPVPPRRSQAVSRKPSLLTPARTDACTTTSAANALNAMLRGTAWRM
jgi:hypothetical protein